MCHQLGGSLEEVLMAEKALSLWLMAYGTNEDEMTKLERAKAVVSFVPYAISYMPSA